MIIRTCTNIKPTPKNVKTHLIEDNYDKEIRRYNPKDIQKAINIFQEYNKLEKDELTYQNSRRNRNNGFVINSKETELSAHPYEVVRDRFMDSVDGLVHDCIRENIGLSMKFTLEDSLNALGMHEIQPEELKEDYLCINDEKY